EPPRVADRQPVQGSGHGGPGFRLGTVTGRLVGRLDGLDRVALDQEEHLPGGQHPPPAGTGDLPRAAGRDKHGGPPGEHAGGGQQGGGRDRDSDGSARSRRSGRAPSESSPPQPPPRPGPSRPRDPRNGTTAGLAPASSSVPHGDGVTILPTSATPDRRNPSSR